MKEWNDEDSIVQLVELSHGHNSLVPSRTLHIGAREQPVDLIPDSNQVNAVLQSAPLMWLYADSRGRIEVHPTQCWNRPTSKAIAVLAENLIRSIGALLAVDNGSRMLPVGRWMDWPAMERAMIAW